MGESSTALVRPVILLVAYVRLACGGEHVVFLMPLKTLFDKCVP